MGLYSCYGGNTVRAMAGSKVTRHIRAVISLVLIIVVYFLDDHYFGPLSGNVFWAGHVYLHKILAMIAVGLIGSLTYAAYPVRWVFLAWIFCYIVAICGLLLLKITFLFAADIYHIQSFALDFVQRYLFSILPFLGLYVLAEIVKSSENNAV